MIAWLQAAAPVPGKLSALRPSGPHSGLIIDGLWSPMYAIAAVTFILVVAALAWALLRRRSPADAPEDPRMERRMGWTVGAAVAGTIVVLFVTLVLDISVGRAITATPGEHPVQIRVTGHQYWWEVQYRDSVAQRWITTANEIHVPVGRPAVLATDTFTYRVEDPNGDTYLGQLTINVLGVNSAPVINSNGCGPTARGCTGASARSTAATSTRRWRSSSWPSRRTASPGGSRRSVTPR